MLYDSMYLNKLLRDNTFVKSSFQTCELCIVKRLISQIPIILINIYDTRTNLKCATKLLTCVSRILLRSVFTNSNTKQSLLGTCMMSYSVMMFVCFKPFRREASLIAVKGAPSLGFNFISFNATFSPVRTQTPLKTVA